VYHQVYVYLYMFECTCVHIYENACIQDIHIYIRTNMGNDDDCSYCFEDSLVQ